MGTVFTIFCHGTNSHRSRTDGEIITEFGKRAAGVEYEDFLILDGPGCKTKGDLDHPMPGKFDPFTQDRKRRKWFWQRTSTPAGLMRGNGWNDNVRHARWAVQQRNQDPDKPRITTINLIGWSRGAVTCLKIANDFSKHFTRAGFQLNIFAIDPVAGLGHKGNSDTSTIPGNVKNYVATLAIHEMRTGFKPQSLKRVSCKGKTNVLFLPFPGKHNTQVRKDAPEELGDVAEIVWFLADKYLRHHGTKFKSGTKYKPLPMNHELLCRSYASIRNHMGDYKKQLSTSRFDIEARGASIHTGFHYKQRDFWKRKRADYVIHGNYFINEHHRYCFKNKFPKTYEWVFTETYKRLRPYFFSEKWSYDAIPGIQKELRSMRKLPAVFQSLKPLGADDPARGSQDCVLPRPGEGCSGESEKFLGFKTDFHLMGFV